MRSVKCSLVENNQIHATGILLTDVDTFATKEVMKCHLLVACLIKRLHDLQGFLPSSKSKQ